MTSRSRRRSDHKSEPSTLDPAPESLSVEDPRPAARRGAAWLALVLLLAGAVTYANSLSNPLVLDDHATIEQNESIRTLLSPAVLMPEEELPVAGRPLVNLSLAINYALGGTDPEGYRLVNIAIHLIGGLLLFATARLLLQDARMSRLREQADLVAFAIALLWLVHPLNSEVIDYTTQRTESMMAVLCLLTLFACVKAAQSDMRPWSRWHTIAVLSCALGMGSKESMVVVPLLALLMDRTFLAGSFRNAFALRWRLHAGLAATWAILAFILWTEPRAQSTGFAVGVSPWTYLLNQAPLITRYLRLSFWPTSLVSNYGWPEQLALRDVFIQALFIVALLALTAYALVRCPRVGFLGAWFFVTLAPASSVIPVATEVGAERRMYLPLVAVIAVVVIGARYAWRGGRNRLPSHFPRRPMIAAMFVLTSVSTALALETAARNRDYRSEVGLTEITLDRYPTPVGHHQLAEQLLERGQREEAMRHLRLAVPDAPRAHYTLGVELYRDGRISEAIEQLTAFVAKQPRLDYVLAARGLLGEIYAARQDTPRASEQFRAILAIDPDHAEANLALGDLYSGEQQFSQAIPYYRRYLVQAPNDADALNQLGLALARTGQLNEAIQTMQAAATVDPSHAPVRFNLALALWQTARTSEALVYARQAVALQPDNLESRQLLRALEDDTSQAGPPPQSR